MMRCFPDMGLLVSDQLHRYFILNFIANWRVGESNEWQDGVFYTLCGAYSVVAIFALIQLIRIEIRVPEYGWTTQKVFHLMNFVVNAARALVFGFYKSVFSFRIQILRVILLDLPGLLFFSTYALLVLFWAEIYNQARSMRTDQLRPGFLIVNGIVYVIQIMIWLWEWLHYNAASKVLVRMFFAAVSCIAALGFAFYGGRLFFMLRRFPLESKGRQNKLHEIGLITAICFTCFIIRTVVVAVSAFNKHVDLDVSNRPLVNLAYYLVSTVYFPASVSHLNPCIKALVISDKFSQIGRVVFLLVGFRSVFLGPLISFISSHVTCQDVRSLFCLLDAVILPAISSPEHLRRDVKEGRNFLHLIKNISGLARKTTFE